MSTIKFNLKSPNSKEPTLIILIFNFNYYEVDFSGNKTYKFLKFSTGEKIHPDYWDFTTCRPKKEYLVVNKNGKPKFPEYWELNHFLGEIERAITDIYRKAINDKQSVTPKFLSDLLTKNETLFQGRRTKKTKRVREKSANEFNFIEFAKNHIDNIKFVYKSNNPTQISNRTKQKYYTTISRIEEFQKETGFRISFDSIGLEFYTKFLYYLQEKKLYTNNTCGKYIASIKSLCRIAEENGYQINRDYKNRRFAAIEEETEKIYLTLDELEILYRLDLTSSKALERDRDLFLIGAYTALRFSDFTNIKPENIINKEGKTFIKLVTFKTGQPVTIPVHPHVYGILAKYNFELPKSISNQKMNENLKLIGKLAGIDEVISTTVTKGGKKVMKSQPKWELITTHTARRSAATNMFLSGIEPIYIMRITGHKTEKEFMKYIRMDQEVVANKLYEHPFFHPKSSLKIKYQ